MTVEIKLTTKKIGELMAAVDKERPDPAALVNLRTYLLENPAISDALGNLVCIAEQNVVTRSFSTTSLKTAIMLELEKMRDGLGYEDAEPLERSLIAHVVMCWLRLGDCELRYHTAMGNNPSISQVNFWERKLSENQRRYLRACETLTRVRKLEKETESVRRPQSPAFKVLLQQQLGGK